MLSVSLIRFTRFVCFAYVLVDCVCLANCIMFSGPKNLNEHANVHFEIKKKKKKKKVPISDVVDTGKNVCHFSLCV